MATRRSQGVLSAFRQSRTYKDRMRKLNRRSHLETLEERRVFAAAPPVLIQPDSGAILLPNDTLSVAPRELVFTFTGLPGLDRTTLGGIMLQRAGGDGVLGNAGDIPITPGYLDIGNSSAEVVMRFASALPDDLYRATFVGSTIKDSTGLPFNRGSTYSLDFRLNLGAQVVAVVPQPVTRTPAGLLQQSLNTVEVYFNADLLDEASAENPAFYRLLATKATVDPGDDAPGGTEITPVSVDYIPALRKSVLTFSGPLHLLVPDDGTADPAKAFRLRIGTTETRRPNVAGVAGGEVTTDWLTIDPGSSFASATDLGNVISNGTQGTSISLGQIIEPQPYALNFPGGTNEPGHRDTSVDAHGKAPSVTLFPTQTFVGGSDGPADHLLSGPDAVTGISTIKYNFRQELGFIPNGIGGQQQAFNSITPAQKERAREALQLIGRYAGVQFIETETEGIVIATGDLRAVNPFSLTGPGGITAVAGPVDINGDRIIDTAGVDVNGDLIPETNGVDIDGDGLRETSAIILDNGETWNDSPNGLYYITVMSQVMRLLGLGQSYDLTGLNAMGGDLSLLPQTTITSASQTSPIVITSPAGVDHMLQTGDYVSITGVTGNTNANGYFRITRLTANTFRLDNSIGNGVGAGGTFTKAPESLFPGDGDIAHLQHLFRPESKDIDLFKFTLDATGLFTAQVFAERLANSTGLDSYLTLYRSTPSGMELLSRNDDYFSQDSLIRMNLAAGTYYVGVSSAGNESYDPTIADSGLGGTTQGAYQLKLDFRKAVTSSIVDTTGVALDGDADGVPGGVYNFWFRAVAPHVSTNVPLETNPRTFYVDRLAAPGGNGSLLTPFNEIDKAIEAVTNRGTLPRGANPPVGYVGDIIRIVGNNLDADPDVADADLSNNLAYQIGFDSLGAELRDGQSLNVPKNTTVMVDRGVVFQMRRAQISVGSTAPTPLQDRSGGALQVLGTPYQSVYFNSYNQQGVTGTIGRDENTFVTAPAAGDWGGLSFRRDLDQADGRFDWEQQGVFLDYVAHADIRFGGGTVVIDTTPVTVNPIYLTNSRPTIQFNRLENNRDHAMSANPNSFEETDFQGGRYSSSLNTTFNVDYARVGPDIHGNTLVNNTTNSLFIRSRTPAGSQLEELTVAGRFNDTDIVHVIAENLLIRGTPGGASQSTFLTAPPISLIVATASAMTPVLPNRPGFAAGTQLEYRLTYVDLFGNESLASDVLRLTGPITTTSQVNMVGLPTPTGDFVARRLYRRVGGTGNFVLVDQIQATASTFTDVNAPLPQKPLELKVASANDPATPPVAGIVATQTAGGNYVPGASIVYAVAYVDALGREGPLTRVPGTVLAVNPSTQVTLGNLPNTPGSFLGMRVYRSLNGQQFDLVGLADARSSSFVDQGSTVPSTRVPATLNVGVTEIAGGGLLQAGDKVNYRVTFINTQNGLESPSAAVLGEYTITTNNSALNLTNLPTPILPPDSTLFDRLMIYRSVNGGRFEAIPDPLNLPLAPPTTTYFDSGVSSDASGTLQDAVLAPPATLRARPDGSLVVDPSMVIKLAGSRIEVGVGASLIAEGLSGRNVIFTSILDDRYGAGGTFDTPNDNSQTTRTPSAPGDWGGIYYRPDSSGSLDQTRISFAGGAHRVEGTITGLNAVEIHQSDVRVANSRFEFNADGSGGQAGVDRLGRGVNDDAQILISGSQPVIVNNTVVDNRGAFISVGLNALNFRTVVDGGRQTGRLDGAAIGPVSLEFDNYNQNNGPLVRGNLIDRNEINGMLVRGGIATTEVVWDDTDIVHVLFGQVLVPDFHTYGGVRLESDARESLVVKSSNPNNQPGVVAGFVANGRPLEIEDRIGGSLQVLGQPGFPVVLTSFTDDTQSAGKTPDGRAQGDTNGDQILPPLPVGPEIAAGTLINNDVPANLVATTPGAFSFNVGAGGASAAPQGLGTAQGQTLLLANQAFLTQYLPYIDIGAVGSAVALGGTTITTAPTLIADDLVRSEGTFTGANGVISWRADTRMENGGSDVINTITFTAASGTALGDLRLVNYLDPNILAANDDLLYLVGSPGLSNFRAAILDGAQRFGFGLGGVYTADATRLVNASYLGFSADSQPNLQGAITGAAGLNNFRVTPVTTGGTPNINPATLPQLPDPALGITYGPNNAAVAMAWGVSPTAASATITTFLSFIGRGPPVVSGRPGEWGGISIREYANDRNVDVVSETENPSGDGNQNAIPRLAQSLGGLASSNKGGDESLRLGLTVNGFISRNSDVDIYSFTGKSGTEVWLDLDATTHALDSVLELIDIDGNVLARSNDSTAESAGTSAASGLALPMQKTAPYQGEDHYTTNPRDAGMRVFLPGPPNTTNTYFVRVRSGAGVVVRDLVNNAAVPATVVFTGGSTLVQSTTDGSAGTNEQQTITTTANVPFSLTFNGQTTAPIPANATAAQVQTALEALSNINTGDVTVADVAANSWRVTFSGAYRGTDVSQLIGSTVTTATTVVAVPAVNEIQRLTLTGTGAAVLRYDLEFTQPLNLSTLTAAQVQAALEGMAAFNTGDVLVTSPSAGQFDVEFRGQFAGQDVTQLLSGSVAAITELTPGGVGVNEMQQLVVTGSAPIALTFGGQTTAPITGTLTAAKIQLALEGLSSINPGGVLVTAAGVNTFRIEFRNTLAATNVAPIGTGSVAVAVQRQGGVTNERQTVTVTNASSFQVSYNGVLTPAVSVNATAAEFQTALESVVGAGNAAVVRLGVGQFQVDFVGGLSGFNAFDLVGQATNVVTNVAGLGGVSEVQTVTAIDLLSFTLQFSGQTTGLISAAATAAEVQAALEALSNINPGDVVVTAAGPRVWNVAFAGQYTSTNVPQMVGSSQNAVQLFSLANPMPGETFALRFSTPTGPQTTGPIPVGASAAQVQAALVALPAIGAGDVLVTSLGASAWQVNFQGNFTNEKVDPLLVLRSSRAEIRLEGTPTGGTFTVRIKNQTSAPVPYNATAAQLQLALEALSNVDPGDVLVSSANPGGPYTLEFRNNLGFGPVSVSADATGVVGGLTKGAYRLQVRLREEDEVPGTTVRFARISNAATGIEVIGQPTHSPIAGERSEITDTGNNTFAGSQLLGNLLNTDRGALGVAGSSNTLVDVDWYRFTVDYTQIDGLTPVPVELPNLSALTNVVFDLDYADGIARPNMAFYVFDAAGRLVLTSRDSNVADDRPNPTAGSGILDLSRGSVGVADPYIGNISLPSGTPLTGPQTYFVAVASDARIPDVLTQFTTANVPVATALARLEPLSSVRRIVEDHVGDGFFANPLTWPEFPMPPDRGTSALPDQEVLLDGGSDIPYHLGDVPLFVSRDTGDLNFGVAIVTQQDGQAGATATVTTITPGAPGVSEVQRLTVSGVGNFTLTFAGSSTNSFNVQTVTAAQIDAALEALPNIGMNNVTVTAGGAGVFNISFAGAAPGGALSNRDVVQIVPVATGGRNEVQLATLSRQPTAGTFQLVFRGAVTASLAYNASAAEVQRALENLGTIGQGNVFVTALLTGWRVEFRGGLGNQNLPAMTSITSSFPGAVETTQLITVDGYTGVRETVVGTIGFDIADLDFRDNQLLYGLSRDLEDTQPYFDSDSGHLIQVDPGTAATTDLGDDGIITYELDAMGMPVVGRPALGSPGYGIQYDAHTFADIDGNGVDDRLFAVGRRGELYFPQTVLGQLNAYIPIQRNIIYQLNPTNGQHLITSPVLPRTSGAWTNALEIGEILTQGRLSVPTGATTSTSDTVSPGSLRRNLVDGDSFDVVDSQITQAFELDAGFDVNQLHNPATNQVIQDGYFFILDPDPDPDAAGPIDPLADKNGSIYQIDTGPSLRVLAVPAHGSVLVVNLAGTLTTFVFRDMNNMAPTPNGTAVDITLANAGIVAQRLQAALNSAGGANVSAVFQGNLIDLIPAAGQTASIVQNDRNLTNIQISGDTGVTPVLQAPTGAFINDGDSFDMTIRNDATTLTETYRFEFDIAGNGVGALPVGYTAIRAITGVTAASTAQQVAVRMQAAIAGAGVGTLPFEATAVSPTGPAVRSLPLPTPDRGYVIVNGRQVTFNRFTGQPAQVFNLMDSAINGGMQQAVAISTESVYTSDRVGDDIAFTVNTALNSAFSAGAEGDLGGAIGVTGYNGRVNFPSLSGRLTANSIDVSGMVGRWDLDPNSAPGVGAGRVAVPFLASDDAGQMADRIVLAINGALAEAYGINAFREGLGVSLTRGTFGAGSAPVQISTFLQGSPGTPTVQPRNEQQVIAATGTQPFRLTFTTNGGQTFNTASINNPPTAASLQLALQAALGGAFGANVVSVRTAGGTVTPLVNGAPGVSNEIQRVSYDGPFSFTLSFTDTMGNTFTTNPIGGPPSQATIQAALEALPNIGVGNVLVTQNPVGAGQPLQFDVQFVGTLAQTNLPLMTLTSTAPPQNYVVEFQNLLGFQDVLPLTASPTNPGPFTVAGQGPGGFITGMVEIASDLNTSRFLAVSSSGGLFDVTVNHQVNTGVPIAGLVLNNTYVSASAADLTGLNLTSLTRGPVGTEVSQGSVVVSTAVGGTAVQNEIQIVDIDGTLTFSLTFNGATTPVFALTPTVSQLQNALEGLATIGVGNVVVAPGPGAGSFQVQFRGALAARDVPQMVGNFTRQIRYEDTWIATAVDPRTSETRMYAFEYDTVSREYRGLQPVFSDGQTSIPLFFRDPATNAEVPITNVNGLRFSPVQDNLFGLTPYFGAAHRQLGAGHGVSAVIDSSRPNNEGHSSLHFGRGQGGNYSGPGGTYGTTVSNDFSLEGFSPNDKPMLYFTYFVDTDNTQDAPNNVFYDTARVFISGIANKNVDANGDGISDFNSGDWTPLAYEDMGAYINPAPANTVAPVAGTSLHNQTGQWRQARIPLDAFAGMENLRLRFDFSTAGDMNVGDFDTTGEELRTVAGEFITDGQFVSIDGVRYELDSDVTLRFTSGGAYRDGERATISDGVNAPVVFEFDRDGVRTFAGSTLVPVDETLSASDVMFRFQNALNSSGLFLTPRVLTNPDNALVTTLINGGAFFNELQRVQSLGTNNFRLTFNGQTTDQIPPRASAAEITAALEALSNIDPGDVLVTQLAPGDWTVEFQGQYAGLNVAQMLSPGEIRDVRMNLSTFGQVNQAARSSFTVNEPDGTITQATNTGLTPGGSFNVAVLAANGATIGDGAFGATTGDFDMYRLSAAIGQTITVDVFGQGAQQGTLADSFVAIYDDAGNLLAFDDDSGANFDSQVTFTAPATGDYIVVVSGALKSAAINDEFLDDPFLANSGGRNPSALGSLGTYGLSISTPTVGFASVTATLTPAAGFTTVGLTQNGATGVAPGNTPVNYHLQMTRDQVADQLEAVLEATFYDQVLVTSFGDLYREGETFTLFNPNNALQTQLFEFDTGFLLPVPVNGLAVVDGDDLGGFRFNFTVNGISRTFEFNNDATVTPGSVQIPYANSFSQLQLAQVIVSAINTSGLGVFAAVTGDVQVQLDTAANLAATFNNFGNPSFDVDRTTAPGVNNLGAQRVVFTQNSGFSAFQVSQAIATAINTSAAAAWVQATTTAANPNEVTLVSNNPVQMNPQQLTRLGQTTLQITTDPLVDTVKRYDDLLRLIRHSVDVLPGVGPLRGPFGLETALAGDVANFDGAAPDPDGYASSRRGIANTREGVYFDDFIVGFAERGEMTSGITAANTNFINNPALDPLSVLLGAYQFEVRRGVGYEFVTPLVPGFTNDPNDRFARQHTLRAPAGVNLLDGQTFTLYDGKRRLTFEFNDNAAIPAVGVAATAPGNQRINFNASDSDEAVARAIRDAINSLPVQAAIAIQASIADGTNPGQFSTNNRVNLVGAASFVVNGVPADETNDTLATAIVVPFDGSQYFANGTIGDNPNVLPGQDVDLYRLSLATGQKIRIDIDANVFNSPLDSYLRIFDAAGAVIPNPRLPGQNYESNDNSAPAETANLDSYVEFVAPAAGVYYIGVSGFNNRSYDPVNGTGAIAGTTGSYQLEISSALSSAIPSIIFDDERGDTNLERDQGQIILSGNVILNSQNFGVLIDAGVRAPVDGNAPHQGPSRNTQELNASNLVPGVVVSNNVIFGNLAGGIRFSGAGTPITNATNATPIVITAANHGLTTGSTVQISDVLGNTAANGSFTVTVINANSYSLVGSAGNGAYTGGGTMGGTDPIPFGRIVNNTIFGGGGTSIPAIPARVDVGIQVDNNAGPSLLNNIVANFTTGVNVVDSVSQANTLLAGMTFQGNGTNFNVSAGGDFAQLLLPSDPLFRNAAGSNFYPLLFTADRNEVQQVAAGSVAFTLTFAGQTTAAIPVNATAATVQTELVALSNIAPTDVLVTDVAPGVWNVEFLGQYARLNVPQMTASNGAIVQTISSGGAKGGSPVIDSAVDSLLDRASLVTVRTPLGISPSPILSPDVDIFGQTRIDTELVFTDPGLGLSSSKDRGAIDAVDLQFGPSSRLETPQDNDSEGVDRDPTETVVVLDGLQVVREFKISLSDGEDPSMPTGSGIDDFSVLGSRIRVFRNDGITNLELTQGVDYVFSYDSTSNTILLTPPGNVWQPGFTYLITLDPAISDNAGNGLSPNHLPASAFNVAGAPTGGYLHYYTIFLGSATDYGDAPDTYGTLAASNGPSHQVLGSIFLGTPGASVSAEPDGKPSSDASADDLDNGVQFVILQPSVAPNSSQVIVTSSATAKLDAWMDLNRDGKFADFTASDGVTIISEKVISGFNLVAGQNQINFSIPDASVRGQTFARFRMTTAGIDSPLGPADDGEVEDYQITLSGPKFQNPNNRLDVNNDGFITGLDAIIVVNYITVFGFNQRVADILADPPPFLDVNGDGFLTGLDSLDVANWLNTNPIFGNPEGEGEFGPGGTGSGGGMGPGQDALLQGEGEDGSEIAGLLFADFHGVPPTLYASSSVILEVRGGQPQAAQIADAFFASELEVELLLADEVEPQEAAPPSSAAENDLTLADLMATEMPVGPLTPELWDELVAEIAAERPAVNGPTTAG